MRTVEKYQSFAEHILSDKRVTTYGMMLVKNGLRGSASRVNPVVMYIDAALSVIEACNSYLNYACECEVTKQILAGNERIRKELQCEFDILVEQHVTQLFSGQSRIKELENHLNHKKLKNHNTIIIIKRHLDIAKSMHQKIKQERENGITFEALNNLQLQLDRFMRSCLAYLIESFE